MPAGLSDSVHYRVSFFSVLSGRARANAPPQGGLARLSAVTDKRQQLSPLADAQSTGMPAGGEPKLILCDNSVLTTASLSIIAPAFKLTYPGKLDVCYRVYPDSFYHHFFSVLTGRARANAPPWSGINLSELRRGGVPLAHSPSCSRCYHAVTLQPPTSTTIISRISLLLT